MKNGLNRKLLVSLAYTILIIVISSTSAPGMEPKEILRKADEARGSADGVQWEISIDSVEGGNRQHRLLKVTSSRFNSLAEFLAPPSVKGQKLLTLDRNMWFWKPGLSKAIPISVRQKLLGGAANGDIAATNYATDYKIQEMSEGTVDGDPCYVFDLTAVDNQATYDRIRYWISKGDLLGIKSEFYTVSGKLFKTARFEYGNSITVRGQARAFISRMVITGAILKDDVTTMRYGKAVMRKVPDSVFNLNLLAR